jgi:hypothetical protein
MPRTIGKTPVATAYSGVKIIQGRILSVDKVAHTVDVMGENNESFPGISFLPKYLNPSDGSSSFLVPEVNMVVWVCRPSSQSQPFVLGAASPHTQSEDGEDPDNYRLNRPVLNEGDEMISRGSGYIVARKSGMIEIGSSQMSRTLWVPVDNLIHSLCENFIIDTPGGSMTLSVRDEDETWGSDISPVEFRLNIKEFANDQFDMFDLRVGRIAAEDDTFIPIVGGTGEIVARLVVNRHFIINVDKSGNVLRTLHGSEVENIEGSKFSTVHKTFQQIVRGLYKHDGGSRFVSLSGGDDLTIGTTRRTTIGGAVTEQIGGQVTRDIAGRVLENQGPTELNVKGYLNTNVIGPSNEVVAGGKSLRTGENLEMAIAGKMSVTVGNAQFPLEGKALELIVSKGGELDLVNVAGKIVHAAGGIADFAVARIVIKPTGSIVIQNALGLGAQFEVNATGVKLSTPAGDITLSSIGAVHLGIPGGGGIVTTATHPFDLITGVPTIGVSTVTANGIPAPGPVGVPPVFIPDIT